MPLNADPQDALREAGAAADRREVQVAAGSTNEGRRRFVAQGSHTGAANNEPSISAALPSALHTWEQRHLAHGLASRAHDAPVDMRCAGKS